MSAASFLDLARGLCVYFMSTQEEGTPCSNASAGRGKITANFCLARINCTQTLRVRRSLNKVNTIKCNVLREIHLLNSEMFQTQLITVSQLVSDNTP